MRRTSGCATVGPPGRARRTLGCRTFAGPRQGWRSRRPASSSPEAKQLFDAAVDTISTNLRAYDLGFWSLYEQSGTRLKMIASPFYHRLHIVQLQVMAKLTGDEFFQHYADRWMGYLDSAVNRGRALVYKTVFKLCYY